MYIPKHFKAGTLTEIFQFCEKYSFATLISGHGNELSVNHFPVLMKQELGSKGAIIGHMARSNPQWKSWQPDTKITCVFNGPHRYISPSWYSNPMNVPTWNYAVVHMLGTPKLIEDHESIEIILQSLVDHHEALEGSNWKYDLPDDFRRGLTKAIVGFEIQVMDIQAKFKLSQNRDEADRLGAIHALSEKDDEVSQQMVALMKAQWVGRF